MGKTELNIQFSNDIDSALTEGKKMLLDHVDLSVQPKYRLVDATLKSKMTDLTSMTLEEAALSFFQKKIGLDNTNDILGYYQKNPVRGIAVLHLKNLKKSVNLK